MKIEKLKRKMSDRPKPGQKITVFMENGEEIPCAACSIISDKFSGILIYQKRHAIDESKAIGWMPRKERQ